MTAPIPKIVAHRGGSIWAPENTMAAFRKSLDLGVDGLELDIQRCKSGELVVFHDLDLSRTTNGAGYLCDASYDELKRLSAGQWFDPEFAAERIPLLRDVLGLVDGQAQLNIEVKNTPIHYPGIEDDLIELLGSHRFRDTLIISSFDHQLIQRIHKKDPELKLALLADALLINIGQYAKQLGTTFWHPYIDSATQESVAEAHKASLTVNAWTLNEARQWTYAINIGIDGIITDDPLGLQNFLSR